MPQLRTIRLIPEPGVEIVADELTGEGPAYVFLHGLSASRAGDKSDSLMQFAWRRQRGFLRVDLRGHGESDGRLGHATVSEMVADVEATLDHAGEAVLVGSSMGGLIAAWAAARRPAQVRGLLLMAPALGLLESLAAGTGPAVLETDHGLKVTLQPRVLADAARWDERRLADRLTMPVLIVHGEHDGKVPVAASRQLFAGIAHDHKELWVVPGGDHSLMRELPGIWERLARALP